MRPDEAGDEREDDRALDAGAADACAASNSGTGERGTQGLFNSTT
jgi:hypothetical protein